MTARQAQHTLEALLDEIGSTERSDSTTVSVDDVLDKVGHRSFGPILFVPALIAFTPLGGVPGLPSALAVVVILVAGQMAVGTDSIWLPRMVRSRSIDSSRLASAVSYLRPVARVIDRLLKPRLLWLTGQPFVRLAAGFCILVALTIPPLEIVPFAGTVSWGAIAAFALALVFRDGLLALIAFGFAVGSGYVLFAAFA
ncbi:MAG: exopolysaccharide biosynthesis protein [Rhizobiaceae bacterium]|nr:exopolysaccharide biosynthesis protein [Rhizobiaceae bacterium]